LRSESAAFLAAGPESLPPAAPSASCRLTITLGPPAGQRCRGATLARRHRQIRRFIFFVTFSVLLFVFLDWVGRFLFPFSLKPSNSPGNSRRVAPTLALRPLRYLEVRSDNRSRSIGLDHQGATQLPQSFSNAAESHTTAAARIQQFALLLPGDALPVVPNFNSQMAAVLLDAYRRR
jgi:hypothetical protein